MPSGSKWSRAGLDAHFQGESSTARLEERAGSGAGRTATAGASVLQMPFSRRDERLREASCARSASLHVSLTSAALDDDAAAGEGGGGGLAAVVDSNRASSFSRKRAASRSAVAARSSAVRKRVGSETGTAGVGA